MLREVEIDRPVKTNTCTKIIGGTTRVCGRRAVAVVYPGFDTSRYAVGWLACSRHADAAERQIRAAYGDVGAHVRPIAGMDGRTAETGA